MKIKCDSCDGQGEWIESQGLPSPEQWIEYCKECNATGFYKGTIFAFIKYQYVLLVRKYRSWKYEKFEIDEDIPF